MRQLTAFGCSLSRAGTTFVVCPLTRCVAAGVAVCLLAYELVQLMIDIDAVTC
jgi:hypothetical protein